MGAAIGQVLSLGVGVALSPIPIIAVVLMLGTPRARANGPAFVLGWVIGLALVGTLVLLAASGADASEGGEPATWVGVLELVLGCLLGLVAVKQWRGRPHEGEEAALPKWMQAIDTFGPGKALGLAVLLSAINPKNLLLTIAAAAAIAQTGTDTGSRPSRWPCSSSSARSDRGCRWRSTSRWARAPSACSSELKAWMAAHNAAIMAVLCLVIGAKLIGDGITGLRDRRLSVARGAPGRRWRAPNVGFTPSAGGRTDVRRRGRRPASASGTASAPPATDSFPR